MHSSATANRDSTKERLRQVLISGFILTYIIFTALWLCPPSNWRSAFLGRGKAIINYVGLWQDYSLFSPPKNFNGNVEAEVLLANGSKTLWTLPSFDNLDLLKRMQIERYRKLINDNVYYNGHRLLWPDFARYIADGLQNEKLEVKQVTLARRWRDLRLPDANGNITESSVQVLPYYTYSVTVH